MRLRFQADADLNHQIVAGVLRLEPATDFRSARAAALAGLSDPDVLALCAGKGRVLVTHDQKTMPGHFAKFSAQRESPGVIIVPQHMPVGAAIAELYLAWTASEAEEWVNVILRLPL